MENIYVLEWFENLKSGGLEEAAEQQWFGETPSIFWSHQDWTPNPTQADIFIILILNYLKAILQTKTTGFNVKSKPRAEIL